MKKPITKKNMFENEPTRSILNLLIEFEKSLRPMYIRYALKEEYAPQERINKELELTRNVSEMKEFFGDRLERLYQTGRIVKGCIHSREHLNYYLKILERKLGVIETEGKKKKTKYIIKPCYYNEGKRSLDKAVLDHYSLTDIFEYESPHAVQRRPHVLEPILRVYGMDANVVKHAGCIGKKKELLSTLDKIEDLSLELSQLKDDIGEEYKIKLFLDECKKLNDEKLMVFVKNQFNLKLFHMIFYYIEDFYVKHKTAKTYPDGILMTVGGKKRIFISTERDPLPPTEKGRKKIDLSSEQIGKIVKVIVKVDRECRDIYNMGVYPSIVVSECPSRNRTGAVFTYYNVYIPKSAKAKLNRKRSEGTGNFIRYRG
jgi:hypothetical protein